MLSSKGSGGMGVGHMNSRGGMGMGHGMNHHGQGGKGGKGGKGGESWRQDAMSIADSARRVPNPQYDSTMHQHRSAGTFADFHPAQPLYDERGSAKFMQGASPRHSAQPQNAGTRYRDVTHEVSPRSNAGKYH